MKVTKIHDDSKLPERKTPGACGYDLYADSSHEVRHGETAMIGSGVSVQVPVGYYGAILGRSGNASRGITVHHGVIDNDYTGEVGIILTNLSGRTIEVRKGERIAQLVLVACATPDLELVDKLDETERGSNGFGSSGR